MTTTNFPKIDLHLHIDGSLSLPCFQTLASNVGLSMTDAQIRKAVMVSDTCQSLPEYLQCFELPVTVHAGGQAVLVINFQILSVKKTLQHQDWPFPAALAQDNSLFKIK